MERIKQVRIMTRLMRAALRQGQTIAVYGWRSSGHDIFTKSLEKKRYVSFYCPDDDRQPPSSTGFVLSTGLQSHPAADRIKTFNGLKIYIAKTGEIKRMLTDCTDLMPLLDQPQPVKKTTEPAKEEGPEMKKVKGKRWSFKPTKDQIEEFALKLMDLVGPNGKDTVFPSRAVTAVVRECFGEHVSVRSCVAKKLLVPHVADGNTMATGSKLGPHMLKVMFGPITEDPETAVAPEASPSSSTSSSLERVQRLLGSEQLLKEERNRLTKALAESG